MKSFMPVCLNVADSRIVIIGGGKVALQKLQTIILFSDKISVYAGTILDEIKKLNVSCHEKEYISEYIEGAMLVYACTDDAALNRRILDDCRKNGTPANIADAPNLCDFISPALFKNGNMSVAVSSNGDDAKKSVAWRNMLRRFLSGVLQKESITLNSAGKVWLVGAGPGDPELLTIKADKILSMADVIFFDDLLDDSFQKRYSGEFVYVGKRKGTHCITQEEISEQLYQASRSGKIVVRLKGGDPLIFSRGGEELDYLQSRGVEVEVIPGISAFQAAAASQKIPLSHRGISRTIGIASGHYAKDDEIPALAADTAVYYMASTKLKELQASLLRGGKSPEIPVALIRNASLPDEQVHITTLREMADTAMPSPLVIIIGKSVKRHR